MWYEASREMVEFTSPHNCFLKYSLQGAGSFKPEF
jgi:hypothetical protein